MNYLNENALVHQKNAILGLINEGEYDQATRLINFSEELWAANDYAYKTQELRQRIRDAVRDKMIHSNHHMTEQKWRRLYDALPG